MATTYQQPLLNPSSTTKKPTSNKTFLYLFLSLVAVICPVALLSSYLTTTTTTTSHSAPLSSPQVCAHAHDQNSCLSFVTPLVEDSNAKFSEIDLLKKFLNISISHIENAMTLSNKLGNRVNDMREKAALTDCVDLMDSSIGRTLDSMSVLSKSPSQQNHFDAQTWLSSVLTNHVTCLDELPGSSEIKTHLEILIARARTSLAILTSAMASTTQNDNFLTRSLNGKFPPWVTHRDRKLLSGSNAAVNADLVVAKDGSGNFKTIKEAVAAAPTNSKVRYTIYIKKGTYKEQVEIPKNKKNLMLTGDSMDLTIITGSLNVADGSTTFKSATLIVGGDGFIAQDLWIQNTAGAVKHQAVALRVSADLVVINRCRLDAYQDTLYTHTLRQFYRDCFVTGTVDFIFGDAAVVLQKCQLTPRKPMAGQGNMVTVQGRTDPNSNTGISIQNCDIVPSSDLAPVKANFKTYLGRPWKEYSRTVIMQTNIGDVIHPAGWSIWTGDFALKTLYYGEYMNRGAGAGTSKRVTWPGYHPAMSTSEANKFTVGSFIQGGVWLKSTGVAYTEGL